MVLSKKSLKYRLLLLMAELGDVGLEFLFNEVSKGKRVYLGRRRYRSDYCKRILKSLTTTGYIERINKDGTPTLRITPIAKTKLLKNDIPLLYLQKRKWQGRFNGLAYDFPEKRRYRRNELRELVRTWGFGQFQLSLWITPHPLEEVIDEFIYSNKLQNFAFRFSTRKLSVEEGSRIAVKTWPIGELKNSYNRFVNRWFVRKQEKKLKPAHIPAFEFEYSSLLEQDPYLPMDLLPADWPADEAREVYLEVKETLGKL